VKNAAGLIREGVTIGTSGVCIERGGHPTGRVLQWACQRPARRLIGASAGLCGGEGLAAHRNSSTRGADALAMGEAV
jgi:hypothetical protein